VQREREIGTVMALKAQWNLVLRLLVDDGVRKKETCGHHLFGKVDLEFLRCIR
jgi:hypothetical protein